MFSGSKKFVLIALFTAILIILVNLAWWFYYQKTETMLDNQLGRRLAALAHAAAGNLSPAQVELLAADDIQSYLETIAALERARQADSLSEVFVLDENYHYLATTILEADSVYFLAELNGPVIDSLFYDSTAGVMVSPTYQSGGVYLKSAFAPLSGVDGFVIAVLGVEANVDYFDALTELRHNLYYATGLSLLGGLVLGVLFLLLQRRINRAEQQLFLGQTHAHLGRMVAVVAHEIRNPLMIIRASAERLAQKTGMAEAGFIEEEIDRLNEIVSGYLDFARSGGSLLAADGPSAFNLAELLAGVKKHLFDKFPGEEITWIGGPGGALSIVGYPRSLRQVLLNLLLNGVEACRQAKKPVEVGIELTETGNSVDIRVIDHGCGLSRKELKKVFEPFYTTGTTGSGLGLYLSREIVMQMNGEMKIVSESGKKTEVIVSLPKQPDQTGR